MKNIKVVIGANFGDEGKGLITDYLAASLKNGIVVRFNGGAQAGHTVTTPEGLKHVFGHVGAGTLAGLPTYLSSFFVVNPMLLVKEASLLKTYGVVPRVYIDSQCMVTTPYDMMINQIAEICRGGSKHGSCGVGFNETITRGLSGEIFKLSVTDLKEEHLTRQKLRAIQKTYTPERLKQLGMTSIPTRYMDLLKNDLIIENYLEDVRKMLNAIDITNIELLTNYDSLLFEGAQGLLLDQSHMYFPHVTRSNTGIKNVAELVGQAGLGDETLEIVYVTRAYLTRHGAGPFPTEAPEKPYPRIEDLTNVPNPYQGALRYGWLDVDLLLQTIRQDLKKAEGIHYNVKLAVTCLDQLDDKVDFIVGAEKTQASPDVLVGIAMEALKMGAGYLSYGPTRNTILPIHDRLLRERLG